MPKLEGCSWNGRASLAMVMVLMVGASVAFAADPPAEPTALLAFGTGLDRTTRALTGEGTEFPATEFSAEAGQVFCLTRLTDMSAPTTITHVWYHEGKTMARVDLNVGGASWRTWSSKRILPAWTGQWEVKVLDADGMVLASSGFVIK